MKRIKVLYITTSLKVGGAETLLVNLAKQIQNNVELSIVYFHDGPNRVILEQAGINLFKIDGELCLYDPIFILRLYKKVRALDPDVIHAWLWSANLLGSLVGSTFTIPVVASIHSVYNKTAVAQNSAIKTLMDKVTIAISSKIVFVSESTKSLFKQFHEKFPEGKSLVINNAVKLPSGQLLTKQKRHNFIIGAVGRFIPLKNHGLLIDTFAQILKDFDQVELWLIGYGPLEDQLRQKVIDLGIKDKVFFIKTNNPKIYYEQMDCFVLPSDQEGLSISLLEAMSFGVTPIVTSIDGKHDMIIDSINGLVMQPGVNSVSAAIRRLMQDAALNQFLSIGARKTIETRFNFDDMCKRYKDLYKNMAQGNN